MKPDDRDDVDAMRALHRQASDEVDAAPDPSVRAAVLAAAARAVDARPHALEVDKAAAAPFGRRRWPVSMAALLVVSLMTGLVVNQAMRDEPDRVTSAAAPPAPPAAPAMQAKAPTPRGADSTAETGPPPARAPDARTPADVAKAARPRADRGPPVDGFAREAPAAKIVATPRSEPAPARDAMAAAPPPAPTPSAPSGKARAAAASLSESAADEARTVAGPAAAVNTAQRMRRGPEPLTPETWVERIVKLRESGDGVAADHEVEALHARYPDFEIPAAALGPTGTR